MARVGQETWDHIEKLMEKFFLNHSKDELYSKGLSQSVMVYPVYTPKDIAENVQLEARKYWVPVEHPELGDTITYPGATAKASLTPMPIRRRAPLIGEHNQQVYHELGFAKDQLLRLKEAGVI